MTQLSRETPRLLKNIGGRPRDERTARSHARGTSAVSKRDKDDSPAPKTTRYQDPDSDDESAAESEKINSANIKRSSFGSKPNLGPAKRQEQRSESEAQTDKNGVKRKVSVRESGDRPDLQRLTKTKRPPIRKYSSKTKEAEEKEAEREERQKKKLKGQPKEKGPAATFQSLPDDICSSQSREHTPNFELTGGDKNDTPAKAKTFFRNLSEEPTISPKLVSRWKKPISSREKQQDNGSQTRKPTFHLPFGLGELSSDGADKGGSTRTSASPEPVRFRDDFPTSSDEDGDGMTANKASVSVKKLKICPWCGDDVDAKLLNSFAKGQRLNVRQQTRFCEKHKAQADRDTWQSRGYPAIDWVDLPARISIYFDELEDIIKGEPSYFRAQLAKKIESGTARNMNHEGNLTPGYYGPKGGNIMSSHLMKRFERLLKQRAIEDGVISGRGPAAFVQGVLVAELAVRLIMDDLGVLESEAQDILEESKELGERLHKEA